MPDLDDVLSAAEGARATSFAGAQIPDDTVLALAGVVRARRARRRAFQTVMAVPVVALLGAGAWLALGHDQAPVPPVTQEPGPTHSSTPPPSPTRTPTSTPTSSATPSETDQPLVALPGEPGLPPRYEAPAGILADSGPGWVLAVYEPMDRSAAPSTGAVVLADPQGKAYELVRFDPQAGEPAGAWRSLALVDWKAGDPTALVQVAQYTLSADGDPVRSGDCSLATLDVTTGELRDAGQAPRQGACVEVGAQQVGGVRTWASPDELDIETPYGRVSVANAAVALSPTGRYVVEPAVQDTPVVDTASGDVVGKLQLSDAGWPVLRGDGYCSWVGWWTEQEVLVECLAQPWAWGEPLPANADPRLVVLPIDASGSQKGTVLVSGADPVWFSLGGVWLADGVVAAAAYDQSAGPAAYLVSADGVVPVTTPGTPDGACEYWMRASDGHLVLGARDGCQEGSSFTLWSVDPAGAATTMLPLPEGVVADGGSWDYLSYRDVGGAPTSWVIAR